MRTLSNYKTTNTVTDEMKGSISIVTVEPKSKRKQSYEKL